MLPTRPPHQKATEEVQMATTKPGIHWDKSASPGLLQGFSSGSAHGEMKAQQHDFRLHFTTGFCTNHQNKACVSYQMSDRNSATKH